MREPVNTWTHFVTFLAGVVGLAFLIVLSRNNPSKLITMTIYGVSVIMLYGASTVYHWVKTTPENLKIHLLYSADGKSVTVGVSIFIRINPI